jgi:Flp pilus assembly protein TadD
MARLGKSAEAVAAFKMAAQLEPDNSRRHSELALALADDGQKEQAEKEYREATRLEPGWVEYARNAAWELLMRRQPQPGDSFVALRIARQAHEGAGQPTTELLDTLAAAYAEVGNYEKATEIARKALSLAGMRNKELAKQIQGRLVNYEHHKPIPKE